MGVRDVVFTILAIDEASRTMEKIGLKADETGGSLGKFGALAGGALVGVAVAAGAAAIKGVELATTFQSSMEILHTEAHVSQASVDQLSGSVLDLAGKVGTDSNSLANALYHIESTFASTGISGKTAMSMLQTAAEGAKIGHADLVDTTNALNAAVVSGIPGVKDFNSTMGQLTAIVGAGDMSMQDLAEAFGGGNITAVKTYGLNIGDVSAALALFGDNQVRGAEAGTMLRMAVQSLAVPARTGAKELAAIGLTTKTLGQDMAKGGLNKAVGDLVEHLNKAGIKGANVGQALTELFGKKGGQGINMLVDQFGRLQGKYAEVNKGAHGFGEAWKSQQQTFSQVWDRFKATVDALLTRLGLFLLPTITKVMNGILNLGSTGKGALDKISNSPFMQEMAPKLEAMGAGLAKLWGVLEQAGATIAPHLIGAWQKIGAAVGPAIAKIADTINKDVIPALSDFVKAITPVVSWLYDKLAPAVSHVFTFIGDVIDGALKIISGIIEVAVGIMTGHWGKAWNGIKDIVSGAWEIIKSLVVNGLKVIWDLLSAAISLLWNVGKALFEGLWNGMKSMWGAITGWVSDKVHGLVDAIKNPLGIHSPSKVFHEIGTNIIDGLLAGFKESNPKLAAALRVISDQIASIKASPSLRTGLKVFADRIRADLDADNAALKAVDAKLKTAKANVASIVKARTDYATALAGNLGGDITSMVQLGTDSAGGVFNADNQKALTKAEDDQTKAADKLAAASKRLADLQAIDASRTKLTVAEKIALANAQDEVTAAQGKFADAQDKLTSAQQTAGATDPATDLRNQLAKRLADIKAFSANLAHLKTEGLSDALIQQMAKAGLDSGGQMAAALAAGTPDTVKQINTLNAQITQASDQFGSTWAGDMYNTGINAAEGVVKGLQSRQRQIDTAISGLGKRLATGVQSALTGHGSLATVTPITAARSAGHSTVVNITLPQGLLMGSPEQLARALEQTLAKAAGSGVKVNLNTKAG